MRDIRWTTRSVPYTEIALGLAVMLLLIVIVAFGLRTVSTPRAQSAAPTTATLNRRPQTFDGVGSQLKPCYTSSPRCGTVTPK